MVEISESGNAFLFAYTREVQPDIYPAGLAHSLHLAYSRDGEHFFPLNQNYGILFAEGEISAEDTIAPKGLKDPRIFRLAKSGFGVTAIRTEEDGSPDEASRSSVLFWTTEDFAEFTEQPPLPRDAFAEATQSRCEAENKAGRIPRKELRESLGAADGCLLAVGSRFADQVRSRWTPLVNTEILLPQSVWISRKEELERIQAVAVYSDGSTAEKHVRWNAEKIDFGKPGSCRVEGTVQNEQYPFPLACGYGDPVLMRWEGSWYFIATNDNTGDIGLYVRKAPEIAGLFAENQEEHLILGVDEEKGFIQTFWAPEFHVIGGRLYILFAVGGQVWGPQCWLMRHREGYDLIDPAGWEEPVRVCRKDGSALCAEGITLDMTYLKSGGDSYLVWSYRRHIGTDRDTGSMLYIARADEENPGRLASDPVLLSRPLYGWENVNGTINNEGPHAFVAGDTVYLTYSGGAADSYTYAVGLFTAKVGADLLERSNWKKSNVPVLTFYSAAGEFGPGHNSFFVNEDGALWIAYHAETSPESHLRCDAVRRVQFDARGVPQFDLTAERDLNPALAAVTMEVIVEG